MKPKIFVTYKPTSALYEAWYENEQPGYVGQGDTPDAAIGNLLMSYPDFCPFQIVAKY